MARQQSMQGLTYAYKAGCKIGSGSDLLGDMMTQRAVEFELKGQVMKPMEVLLSATKVNAELFRMHDKIGSVEPNKYADLIVVQGNPLKNLRVLPGAGQPHGHHEGRPALQEDGVSDAHRDAILDQFTRQATPFAAAPSIPRRDGAAPRHRVSGCGSDDSVLGRRVRPRHPRRRLREGRAPCDGDRPHARDAGQGARAGPTSSAWATLTWQQGDVLPPALSGTPRSRSSSRASRSITCSTPAPCWRRCACLRAVGAR